MNNHFGFSPSAGSNLSRLILVAPFDFSNGLDTQWSYRLTALISDANLRSWKDSVRASPQTGTVIINVRVVDPQINTVITTVAVGLHAFIASQQQRYYTFWRSEKSNQRMRHLV